MATHSSVLAWRIPGTGEPGGLPSMGSHRVDTTEATQQQQQQLCIQLNHSVAYLKLTQYYKSIYFKNKLKTINLKRYFLSRIIHFTIVYKLFNFTTPFLTFQSFIGKTSSFGLCFSLSLFYKPPSLNSSHSPVLCGLVLVSEEDECRQWFSSKSTPPPSQCPNAALTILTGGRILPLNREIIVRGTNCPRKFKVNSFSCLCL